MAAYIDWDAMDMTEEEKADQRMNEWGSSGPMRSADEEDAVVRFVGLYSAITDGSLDNENSDDIADACVKFFQDARGIAQESALRFYGKEKDSPEFRAKVPVNENADGRTLEQRSAETVTRFIRQLNELGINTSFDETFDKSQHPDAATGSTKGDAYLFGARVGKTSADALAFINRFMESAQPDNLRKSMEQLENMAAEERVNKLVFTKSESDRLEDHVWDTAEHVMEGMPQDDGSYYGF